MIGMKREDTANKIKENRSITAAIHNLGCKVNEYEAEKMEALLRKKGFEILPFGEKADVYIINTCTVTNIADRKSRQMLHKARKMNPDALVVAAGCYVDIKSKELAEEAGVDILIKNEDKARVGEIIDAAFERRSGHNHPEVLTENTNNISICRNCTEENNAVLVVNKEGIEVQMKSEAAGSDANPGELSAQGVKERRRERAFVKIQDGCNQFCSYCIIPYARGRIKSRPEKEILEEIEKLADEGYKEVIISGIHIGSYGLDRGEEPQDALLALARKTAEIEGIARIRLGSVEPRLMTEEFIKNLSGINKVCPQFHLSLQSGSDSVLKRMNRKYDTAAYERSCENIRKYFGDAALTTDIIVGFPGESEEEFTESYDFVDRIKFYRTHVFKYSRRSGTVADKMPDQISDEVKTRRSAKMLELSEKNGAEYITRRLGSEVEVLFEEKKTEDGKVYWSGHTREYIQAYLQSEEDLTNRIRNCRAVDFEGGRLICLT